MFEQYHSQTVTLVNKMRSEAANFVPPVTPLGKIRVIFDCGPFVILREKMTSSAKPEIAYYIAVRGGGPSNATNTCTENLVKVGCVRLASRQTNRQTGIYTYALIAILRTTNGRQNNEKLRAERITVAAAKDGKILAERNYAAIVICDASMLLLVCGHFTDLAL